MSSIALTWMGKAGLLARRFVLEVLASAVVTGCVAAATTMFLSHVDTSAQQPAANPGMSNLLSPVADAGAPQFVAVKPAIAPDVARVTASTVALPPPRPRIIAAHARPSLAKANAAPAPAPVPMSMDVARDMRNPSDNEAAHLQDPPRDVPEQPEISTALAGDRAPPDAPAFKPERMVFGVTMPDVAPAGHNVMRSVRGLGDAVLSLVP